MIRLILMMMFLWIIIFEVILTVGVLAIEGKL